MRTPGKGFDEFYQRVQDEGTIFVRGRVAEVTDVLRMPEEAAEDGRLIVQVEDTLAGRQRRIPVDMVILSVGLEPQADANEVARRFGITCSSDGWVIERHPKLDPVATMTEGVFAAGCALGPRDIPVERVQRRGRRGAHPGPHPAARDGARADPRRASTRSAARAAGSATTCARTARSTTSTPTATSAEVNAALCQGCGACVAACPAGAISGTGFSDAQILSQIEGILMVKPERRRGSAVPHGDDAGSRRGASPSRRRVRTAAHRLHLQLVQLPRGRPGRHGAHQVPAQRPPRPADVRRPPRPDLRPEGLRQRRRRRAGHRLLARRLPLPGAELQGPPPLPAPAPGPRALGIEPQRLQLRLGERRRGRAARPRDRRASSRRSGRSARSAGAAAPELASRRRLRRPTPSGASGSPRREHARSPGPRRTSEPSTTAAVMSTRRQARASRCTGPRPAAAATSRCSTSTR